MATETVCSNPHCGKRFLPKWATHRYCSRLCVKRSTLLETLPGCDATSVAVPLRGHDGSIRGWTVIDAEDEGFVNQWNWSLSSNGYARRREQSKGQGRSIFLHRVLADCQPGDGSDVDHIDRDRLNNRRSNLRRLPRGANNQNRAANLSGTSRFRGVHWCTRKAKWRAQYRFNGKSVTVGLFTDELEAARAVREARLLVMPYAVE
jgi:hypothetical protein